jgi:hypothetical protein
MNCGVVKGPVGLVLLYIKPLLLYDPSWAYTHVAKVDPSVPTVSIPHFAVDVTELVPFPDCATSITSWVYDPSERTVIGDLFAHFDSSKIVSPHVAALDPAD